MDASREEFPRISVDSYHDCQRIKTNFTQAIFARFEERLAASGVGRERDALTAHIQRFIDGTFVMADRNIRVNGRNLEDINPQEEEEEPFDETLDKEIWSLQDQRLQWDRDLAQKRRERPQEVARMLADLYRLQTSVEEEVATPQEDEDDPLNLPELDGFPEEMITESESTFQKVVMLAEGLHQAVSTQRERAERVQVVEKEIKALNS
ncbi:hypothetical protein OF83DRAFT_1061929 [Amylostereum chailletii]|nr:hypothetical protein OF83DRAFT_1061929 [Amylostereum chailletii]